MHPQHKALAGVTGVKITDGEKGEFEAVFAVLEVKDHDGDVTMPGAFEPGAEVRISAYNHKSWNGELPVGKGVIEERGDQAVVKGRFFLDTQAGRETFTVVKEMGGLQEWSYGYDTLEEERGTFKGKSANIIKKQKVYEVSPVILGAGIGTQTTAIKTRYKEADEDTKQLLSEFMDSLRSAGREKFNANKERYVWVEDVDLDENWVVFRICDEAGGLMSDGDRLVRMTYVRKDEEVELTGDEEEVEVTYVSSAQEENEDAEGKSKSEPDTKCEHEECDSVPVKGQKLCQEHGGKEREPDEEPGQDRKLSEEEQGTKAGKKLKELSGTLKQLYSDIYWTLRDLGKERFRRHLYVEIYDVDVDQDYVIFRCREEGEEALVKISFQRDSDGNIELSDEEEEVEIETSFVAAKGKGSGDPDADTHGEKKATPFKSTATSEDAWSGPKTIAAIPNDAGADVFKQMFAWVDPKGDADKKSSYKFIHHEWKNGKPGPANLKACTAGIGVLNGGRGGTNIPDADRQGVYNHLARHLKDGDKEPPELKAAPEPTGLKFSDHIDAVMAEVDDLSERAASVVTLRAEKGKKRLGAESHALLKELTARMESLKGLLEEADNDNDAGTGDVLQKVYLDEIARSLD